MSMKLEMSALRTTETPTDLVPAAELLDVQVAAPVDQSNLTESRGLSPERVRSIQKSWQRLRVGMWVCGDVIAGATASSLAQTVRLDNRSLPTTVSNAARSSLTYAQVGVMLLIGWSLVLAVAGAYQPRRNTGLWEQCTNIVRAAVGLLAVVGITSLFLRVQLSRSFVIVALVACVSCSTLARMVVGSLFSMLQRLGIGVDRLLIVGPTRDVELLSAQFNRTSGRRTRVVGSVAVDSPSNGGPAALRKTIEQAVARHGATSVVVGGPSALPTGTVRLLTARLSSSGVNIVVAPGTAEAVGPGVQLHAVGDLFLLRVRDSDPTIVERLAKTLIDRTLSVVALLFLSPVLMLLAIMVRRDSPGPALFRQRRVGRDGRLFTIYKFRSMAGDAEERLKRDGLYDTYVANGYKLPAGNDPRITRLGAMLRRTSLDELPQLLNVVLGSMSLVGPRPVVPAELDCYGDLANAYTGVRPGVTGYWQVNGRSDVGFPERAELDAYYYDNRSLRVDLRILFRTIGAVALRVGAH